MSEPRTRITLLMQDVGWGIEGSYYIDKDAVARILNEHDAALESQNQALQEERDGWKTTAQANIAMVTEHQQAIRALKGTAGRALALTNDAVRVREHLMEAGVEKCEAFERIVAALPLVPPQETDR